MSKITPFLWFNGQAEEAMNFYTSIFKNSKAGTVSRYGDAGPGPKGSVMTANFELDGQPFVALNGGPAYSFTPAISFVVNCDTQQEIDDYWDKLSAGGKEIECGWLTDQFGLSWQIVPKALGQLMTGPNANRVMTALLKMKKLDIAQLRAAAEGQLATP
jgi:predicted 3-demethylubiquinone-9 3-methyltransferase (glyoxalase superfamily)